MGNFPNVLQFPQIAPSQHTISDVNNFVMLGEAILSAESSVKLLDCRCSALKPAWGA